jgi:hypothetical protein
MKANSSSPRAWTQHNDENVLAPFHFIPIAPNSPRLASSRNSPRNNNNNSKPKYTKHPPQPMHFHYADKVSSVERLYGQLHDDNEDVQAYKERLNDEKLDRHMIAYTGKLPSPQLYSPRRRLNTPSVSKSTPTTTPGTPDNYYYSNNQKMSEVERDSIITLSKVAKLAIEKVQSIQVPSIFEVKDNQVSYIFCIWIMNRY